MRCEAEFNSLTSAVDKFSEIASEYLHHFNSRTHDLRSYHRDNYKQQIFFSK